MNHPQLTALVLAGIFAATLSSPLDAGNSVVGHYMEARTCDVWTGPCFANGEINLVGDHAVMAWVVDKGTWNGVSLDGLKVVAVLDAEGTLTTDAQGKVQSVLYIDASATEAQGHALHDMAKQLAPNHLGAIVRVEKKPISHSRRGPRSNLVVGKAEVTLETTPLSHCDKVCGNEGKFYPTLSRNASVSCAKTVRHAYRGSGLGTRWSEPGRRSAMVGSFALKPAEKTTSSPCEMGEVGAVHSLGHPLGEGKCALTHPGS